MVHFDLLASPPGIPRGFAIFFFPIVVYSPPPGMQLEAIRQLRAPDQPLIGFFPGTYFWEQ